MTQKFFLNRLTQSECDFIESYPHLRALLPETLSTLL